MDLSKEQQTSDWGSPNLSQEQMNYAASDVLHLHKLKAKLDAMLAREGRTELAKNVMDFLPTRCELDLAGWRDVDVFAHRPLRKAD
jgi:ribonuclease D